MKQHFTQFMRAKDASAFLGIGESTFWRWVQTGRLPRGTRLSARVTVWGRESLESFIERHTAKQGGVK